MALSYRDLQRPAQVDTTRLETGDSEVAAGLTRAFRSFEGLVSPRIDAMAARRGEQEGATAGATDNPEFRAGLRANSVYGQAYNNAALRSYAIKSEADAEDNGARIEVEAQNDPDKFQVLFGTFRDETVKNAPPEARAALQTIYGRRMTEGVARLSAARAKEQNDLARADTVEGLERAIDKAANLYASNDPRDYEIAVEEETKATLMIDGAFNDGTITATERVAMQDKAKRQLFAQTVSARFRRVLDSATGNPVEFIEKLRTENKTNEALSPSEEEKLVDRLIGDLREHNALLSAGLQENNAALKARYEAGDREATAALFSGELTTGKLRTMVEQQRLDPSRATSLANELASGDKFDDSKASFHIRTNLLQYDDEEIEAHSGLSWKTRAELILKKREEEQGWKGTQAAKEARERIERSLGIVPGTFVQTLTDSEKVQLDTALTEWYNEVDKLPPAERQASVIPLAEDVVGRYIRKNKAAEAQERRRDKEAYIRKQEAKHGSVGEMGAETRKTYEAELTRYDAEIAAFEAEAARK